MYYHLEKSQSPLNISVWALTLFLMMHSFVIQHGSNILTVPIVVFWLLSCTHNELPIFGKVLDILVLPDNSVYFYTKMLQNILMNIIMLLLLEFRRQNCFAFISELSLSYICTKMHLKLTETITVLKYGISESD